MQQAIKKEGKEVKSTDIRVRSPFVKEALEFAMLPKLQMSFIKPYYGKIYTREHLETYIIIIQLHRVSNPILYKAFPTTLKWIARK